MSVVGVDFGNQNVLIAAAGRGGVDVILNGNSQRLNPCLVGFSESRSMGEGAASNAMGNYRNTISCMKRLMGLSFHDARAQDEMKWVSFTCVPFKHTSGGPESIGVQVSYKSEDVVIPMEMIVGMMLKHMGGISAAKAAESSNAPVNSNFSDPSNPLFPRDWVVAIPGYYTDSQRRAFVDAFRMVGIQGLQRLMHEHTATALAYGIFKDIKKEFTKDKPTNVMFIDVGASAYSVCIVAFEPGKLIVKTAQFDPDLGGRNFDQVIANWIADKFEEKYKGKLSGKPMNNPKVALKLYVAAEKAKKTLSPAGVREARISLESLMDDHDFSCTLTDVEYESLCAPLLARLAAPIERALAEANLKSKDLNCVEIVGGGSRVGCLKRTLATILGLKQSDINNGLSTTMNSDESVARGAALQSAILSPRFKVLPYEIIEYQPYPVKVSWDGEASNEQEEGVEVEGQTEGTAMPTNSVIMFGRGSNFPVTRRVTLRRSGEFAVNVSYDESVMKNDCLQGQSADVACFKIKAPDGPANKVRVNIKEDLHGCIVFSSAQMVEEVNDDQDMTDAAESKEAPEGEKKKKVKKTTLDCTESRSFDWSETEINKIYEREVAMSNNDRVVKDTADMRNELESYIYDMRDKIVSESHLAPYASSKDRESMSSALETIESWLYEDGFDATKSVYAEKLKELKKIGDPIVFRQTEASNRPNSISSLQRTIEKYQSWCTSSQGVAEFAHITAEEFDKCFKKCDEASGWMYDVLDKQGSRALYETPVTTVAEIDGKVKDLITIVNPIMYKPKPKPSAEEKKPEDKGPEVPNANAGQSQPMDTDENTNGGPDQMDTTQ